MENINFEVIDQKVKEYAKRETRKFYDITNNEFNNIRNNIKKILYEKKVRMAEISEWGGVFVTVENGESKVIVNWKEIYSTEKLITWIKVHDKEQKLAFFETSGSDYGTLRIWNNGEFINKDEGWFHDYVFASSEYVVKEVRSESITDENSGVPAVYRGEEKVFWKAIKQGMGVSVKVYSGNIFLVVGNEQESTLFQGKVDDPVTWKESAHYDQLIRVIGYRDEKPIIFIEKDYGIIATGSAEYTLEAPIEDVAVVAEGFLLMEMKDAKISPSLYGWNMKKIKTYNLQEPSGLIYMASDSKRAVCVFTSFSSTYAVYLYENEEMKIQENNKVVETIVEEHEVFYNGIRVHYFQMNAREQTKNTLVYGYGGFNIPLTPSFNNLFSYLIQNGINVVVCNLPGGSEYGESWHKLGMRENKGNVYGSFQSVIKKLHADGHRVICYGVSNGGLLSSYTLAKIPDILTGAVIGNPVIDLLKFHKLLAGMYWVSEYGNPDDPEDAKFMKNFSSMHVLERRNYPPSLVYTRINDDRVHPYHALAFHEKMNEFGATSYIMIGEGGHLGATVEEMTDETARIASFINLTFEGKIE